MEHLFSYGNNVGVPLKDNRLRMLWTMVLLLDSGAETNRCAPMASIMYSKYCFGECFEVQ